MLLRLLSRTETLLTFVFLAMVGMFLFGYGLKSQLLPVDMPWHLAQADWMIQHGQLLTQDVFNYPRLGQPLMNEYPLYHLIIWVAWKAGAWGPSLLCALLNVLLFGMYAWLSRRNHQPMGIFAVALFMVLPLMATRLNLRPELVTYLGVAFYTIFLLGHRNVMSWTSLWPLALAQIAWVNSHSGFILGILLVLAFGVEMIVRRSLQESRLSMEALKIWLPAGLLVCLVCFINPYGWERLTLPFHHQGSDVIRAYVTEMQGVTLSLDAFYVRYMLAMLAMATLAIALSGWQVSYAMLVLLLLFGWQTMESSRHIALFCLLFLSVIVSTSTFRSEGIAWPSRSFWSVANALLLLVLTPLLLIPLALTYGRGSMLSIADSHRIMRDDLHIYPQAATRWLQENDIRTALLHRTEAGGWLQLHGFTGLTAGDTGFGKYPVEAIHELGLMCERPGTLPKFIAAHDSGAAVVTHMAHDWTPELRQLGWRPVFFAPSGSVWLPAETRPDLPTLTPEKIAAAWDETLARDGRPISDSRHYQRLLLLAAHGAHEHAFTQMMALPEKACKSPLFWQAATAMSTEITSVPSTLGDRFLEKAQDLGMENNDSTLILRLNSLANAQEWEKVNELAQKHAAQPELIPESAVILVAEALLRTGDLDTARTLLARDTGTLLRNGKRYALMATLAEQQDRLADAADAWKRARFWWPDDVTLQEQAAAFHQRHPNLPQP